MLAGAELVTDIEFVAVGNTGAGTVLELDSPQHSAYLTAQAAIVPSKMHLKFIVHCILPKFSINENKLMVKLLSFILEYKENQ